MCRSKLLLYFHVVITLGLSFLVGTSLVAQLVKKKKIRLQCGRPGFDPWLGKIPWIWERPPTPVFWPGEFHGVCSPWLQKVRHD